MNKSKFSKQFGFNAYQVYKYGPDLVLSVYENSNKKCNICGSTENLAIHHIDGNGRHNEENGNLVNNSLENLQLLCKRCHGSVHSKEYWNKQAEIRGGYLWKGREKEYWKEHCNYNKGWHKKYREKNKEKIKEYNKQYRLKLKKGE